jgi:hypothetical protein
MARQGSTAKDDAAKRTELVASECFEALDHLRRAIDHAAGGDSYMRRLLAAMRDVADLVDHVVTDQGRDGVTDRAVRRA